MFGTSRRSLLSSRIAVAVTIAVLAAVLTAGPAWAHPHVVTTGNGDTVTLADGQNHPGFQPVNEDGLRLSCEGILEPADSGPAGYGLETAHHGPDAGTPGKGDGCYATEGNPADSNPAID
jgi:hypothetical protein